MSNDARRKPRATPTSSPSTIPVSVRLLSDAPPSPDSFGRSAPADRHRRSRCRLGDVATADGLRSAFAASFGRLHQAQTPGCGNRSVSARPLSCIGLTPPGSVVRAGYGCRNRSSPFFPRLSAFRDAPSRHGAPAPETQKTGDPPPWHALCVSSRAWAGDLHAHLASRSESR